MALQAKAPLKTARAAAVMALQAKAPMRTMKGIEGKGSTEDGKGGVRGRKS